MKIAETSIILMVFNGVWSQYLYCYHFSLHEPGTRNTLLGPWLNNTEVYLTPFSSIQNHIIAG
jgi:hypothetical protein